jgi:plastocyanin
VHIRLILRAIVLIAALIPFTSQAKIDTVKASGFAFTPSTLAIHQGDTVRWVAIAGIHTTTSSPLSSKNWNSGTMNPGQQYDVAFTVADGLGSFPYLCQFHSDFGMLGTISVSAAPCCIGMRGNVNQTGGIDASDISALVAYLTGGTFVPPCMEAANVNGLGGVDGTDLSSLVSYMTGGTFIPPNCP